MRFSIMRALVLYIPRVQVNVHSVRSSCHNAYSLQRDGQVRLGAWHHEGGTDFHNWLI